MKEKENGLSCYQKLREDGSKGIHVENREWLHESNMGSSFSNFGNLANTPQLPKQRKRELKNKVRLGKEVAKKLSTPLFDMSWVDEFPEG